MSVTIFGVIVFLVGMLLLIRASTLAMLLFVLVCSLFGGSATIILTALGNSTIPPANMAMTFLTLRCILPGEQRHGSFAQAFAANRWLVLFVLYGSVGAWILPRLFAGAMDVTPLRPNPGRYLMAVYPLKFSSQNITVSFYLLSTCLAGICSYMASASPGAWRPIVRTAAIIAITHAFLGIAGALLAGTPAAAIFSFFRNGYYAQLNQSFGSVVRMNGIWAEPAVYAAYGVIWLVFMSELWLRDIELKWTRTAALVLLLALAASTSSTAYVGLAGYGAVLGIRQIFHNESIAGGKLLWLLGIGLAGATLILAVLTAKPALFDEMLRIFSLMTVNKLDSESGIQRAFWARQGIDAFLISGGLGIGGGSFRSSSLITAILGSAGVIGIAGFTLHLLTVWQPLRKSTYAKPSDPEQAAGAAASWASLVMLLPASIAAPSPDPGLMWGILGGLSLGLRAVRYTHTRPDIVPPR